MTSSPTKKTDEQRIDTRFDKAFPVTVSSELFGDGRGIARNVSSGGILVEVIDLLPLGSVVTVRFQMPDCTGEIEARAEVKHHYCFNYSATAGPASTRGVGLRFVEFMADGCERLKQSFTRTRVLH